MSKLTWNALFEHFEGTTSKGVKIVVSNFQWNKELEAGMVAEAKAFGIDRDCCSQEELEKIYKESLRLIKNADWWCKDASPEIALYDEDESIDRG